MIALHAQYVAQTFNVDQGELAVSTGCTGWSNQFMRLEKPDFGNCDFWELFTDAIDYFTYCE
jgi:hypothetical protein